jgi:hypothetical protein
MRFWLVQLCLVLLGVGSSSYLRAISVILVRINDLDKLRYEECRADVFERNIDHDSFTTRG